MVRFVGVHTGTFQGGAGFENDRYTGTSSAFEREETKTNNGKILAEEWPYVVKRRTQEHRDIDPKAESITLALPAPSRSTLADLKSPWMVLLL